MRFGMYKTKNMSDQIDEWLAAGGLTITAAVASVIVWMRKMRIRLVSGKDIAEMREQFDAQSAQMSADMQAIKSGVEDAVANQQAFANSMTEFRANQEWIIRNLDNHEDRIKSLDENARMIESQVTTLRRDSR